MRIAELDLLAYGGFSGVCLDLSRTGVLHVVFGNNEAGKSTTLRAVHALLYGIEQKTPDAYLHAYADLRLGARVVGHDGRELSFVRRKGSKGTLLDTSGAELDEVVLARMLSGVGREQFAAMFGLDHGRLREGGEQLRLGRGDVGESLFQAGVGAASVHRALASLREQHEAIFTPRGKKQLLHEPLEAFEAAKKRMREDAVRADAVHEQERGLERLRVEAIELDARRRACVTEQSRLQRALHVLSPLARRRTLRAEQAELGATPALPEDAEARRTSLLHDLASCEREQAQLVIQRARLQEQQAKLEIVPSLERESPELMRELARRLAVRRDQAKDLATRYGELRNVEHAIVEALRALPEPVPREDVERLRLDAATLARFGKLGRERGGLLERVRQAQRELDAAEAQAEAARRLLAQVTAGSEGVVLDGLAERLPSEATVAAFARRFEQLDRAAERLDVERAELDERQSEVMTRLDAIARSDAPPTEDALREARAERDTRLQALRERAVAEGRAELASVDALAAHVQRADQLGDRMRREAQRVEQHAELLAREAELTRKRAQHAERVAAHAAQAEALERDWRKAWTSTGIEPTAPSAMQPLRAKLVELLAAGARRSAGRRALEVAEQDLSAWQRGWAELMIVLALPQDASAEEAQAVIDARQHVLARVKDAQGLRHRVEAMEHNASTLRDDARALIERHAPELVEQPAEDAIERLVELHAGTLRDVQARERIAEELRELEAAVVRLSARRAEAARALDQLLHLAGVDSVEALEHEERRARRARELAQGITELERELLAHGDGKSLGQLDAEVEGLVADQARARLAELDSELQELHDKQPGIARDIERNEAGLTVLHRGGAADAAAEVEQQLARVRALALQWARKRLAAELLERTIRRYRERNQDPILRRTAEIFARLTLGAYPRLEVAYDDASQPVLQCMQGGTRAVDVERLSAGTLDQLYLALRVASLERFAESAEPLPLLLDDVLVNFDDERARAAFAVLGELAQKMQVLFFTHRSHDVELAHEALGHDRVVEHRLSREPARAASAPQP